MDLSGRVLRSLSDTFIMPRTFKSCIKLLSHCTTDIKLVPEHNETHQILPKFSKRAEKIKPYTSKLKPNLHFTCSPSSQNHLKRLRRKTRLGIILKKSKYITEQKAYINHKFVLDFSIRTILIFSKEVNYFQMIMNIKIQLP